MKNSTISIKRKEVSVRHKVSEKRFDIIQVITIYEITIGEKRKKKKIGESSRLVECFNLFDFSLDQIEMLIKEGVPLFIYKEGEQYFGTKIPKKLDIGLPNTSKCEIVWHECKYYKNACKCTSYADCIDKSNAISKAYETINTIADRLFVIECKDYCEK